MNLLRARIKREKEFLSKARKRKGDKSKEW